MRKRSEATEQEVVMQWARLQESAYPKLSLLHHIPNGGSRNKSEAANLKRQGVKAGVPDLCLPVPVGKEHGMYIEMKYGKNKTTKDQDRWLDSLKRMGYRTKVCYSAEEAIKEIQKYLQLKADRDRFLI